MLTTIKNWINPPIRRFNIEHCPCCWRSIRKEMTRGQQRRCVITLGTRPKTQIFNCGRCNGQAEYHGEHNETKLVFKRVLRPLISVIHRDVIQMAEDAQSKYNIALLTTIQRGHRPDTTDFSKLNRKEILKAIKRLESRTKNIKK
uniref:Uncharacterized protein n=1 Tax=Pseudomonas phage HRDY3 TaxID=3236930 RepID=A0AB39CEP2_9VIRU